MKILISTLLAILGGYADVVCFIRFNVFPATQTGNVIYVGRNIHHLLVDREHKKEWPDYEEHELGEVQTLCYRVAVIAISAVGAYTYCRFEHAYPRWTATLAAPVLSLFVLFGSLMPLLCGANYEGPVNNDGRWSVLFVSYALGAVHFLCGPTSDGSRLKAVTFAATGHLHKMTKLLWKVNNKAAWETLKESERASVLQSTAIFFGMIFGAICGAFTYHHTDIWLFAPVSAMLFIALVLHDRCLDPPASWGDLSTPLIAAEAGKAVGAN